MDVLWLFSSALGSALVIVGLYLVLWAKTKEASGAAPSSNVNVLMVEEKSKQATKQQAQDVWKKKGYDRRNWSLNATYLWIQDLGKKDNAS